MPTRVDSLRNTLDHLALDSGSSEDRRYLVSMLRRLGYSDAEIEVEIGPVGDLGSEARVIEVEYEGPVRGAQAPAAGRETTFQVAQPGGDGLTFRLSGDDAPSGAGTEEVHATDLSGVESDLGDWGDDFEQGDRDDFTSVGDGPGEAPEDFDDGDGAFSFSEADEDEELVEFRAIERPDAAVAAGWHEAGDAEAAGWTEDTTPEWDPAPEESPAEASDDAWDTAEDNWDTAPEDLVEWPEADAEPEAPVAETEAWPETEEVFEEIPEPVPEPVSEPAEPTWDDAGWEDADVPVAPATTHVAPLEAEPWPVDGPEEAEAEETEADTFEAADAYSHGEYTLYTREVQLSTGRRQRIYFFAKNEPQSGDACPLPDGYEVIENEKTGLPFLRRKH